MEVQSLGDKGQQTAADQTQQTQASAGDTAAPGGESASKTTRPEWLPESYFDADAGQIRLEDFGKHYGELATAAKAEADRISAYPQKVEDLKFTLPADLKLPEGVTFDEKNPQFAAFRQFIFDKKIDPAVGSEIAGMYVRQMAGEVEAVNNRVEEEIKKLGDNGAARITALRNFWTGFAGEKVAKAIMGGVFTSEQVDGMEKAMLAISNQNTSNPPGGARDDDAGKGLSDEEYEAMSPRQRLEYARSKHKPAQ